MVEINSIGEERLEKTKKKKDNYLIRLYDVFKRTLYSLMQT